MGEEGEKNPTKSVLDSWNLHILVQKIFSEIEFSVADKSSLVVESQQRMQF